MARVFGTINGTHHQNTGIYQAVEQFLEDIFTSRLGFNHNSKVFDGMGPYNGPGQYGPYYFKIFECLVGQALSVRIYGRGSVLTQQWKPVAGTRCINLTDDHFNNPNNVRQTLYIDGRDTYNWNNNTRHVPGFNHQISFRYLVVDAIRTGRMF